MSTVILVFGGLGVVLLLVVVFSMLNQFLIKADPGEALVKTGFGVSGPTVFLSSSFVLPLLHRVDTLDMTVKTVRIQRREQESLSCADGIRAEVEVDFYIKINPVEDDIQHVASSIGCGRASDTAVLRELFEAKFADALKTAGAKLEFDQLYHNRQAFRDEILKALGGGGGDQTIVLNGYKLDDVAIQYLEQLPLEMHNEDNVLDARGRKEIAERTSDEAESANKRLRQKEVTISEQNREARLRQLSIDQNIAEEEAAQEREIEEAQAREQAQTEKTVAEQEQLSEEARIQKEQNIRISEEEREQSVEEAEIKRQQSVALAEEEKQQEIENAEIQRQRAVEVAEEEKAKEVEIAGIERESAEAEAEKKKLVKLEETAKQEAEYVKAEEQKKTVQAVEEANRTKEIEVIEAEQDAAVEREEKQVEADVKAYEKRTVAEAELEAAQLEAEAAEEKAMAIETVGMAEAKVRKAELDAENEVSHRLIIARTLQELVPQLPTLVEHLMKPTEQIDDLRVLNVKGLNGGPQLSQNGASGDGAAGNGSIAGSVLNTVLDVGALLPVLREVMNGLNNQSEYKELVDALKQVPGGETLVDSMEQAADDAEESVPMPSSPAPSDPPAEAEVEVNTDADDASSPETGPSEATEANTGSTPDAASNGDDPSPNVTG